MGYTTDFTGSVTVEPPLNPHEIDYLARFAESRRNTHTGGPYDTADIHHGDRRLIDNNRPPEGQPSLWCDFVATADGTGIEWNGTEKFHDAEVWMQYLIDTFLKPGATVQAELADPVPGRAYDPAFAHFTFDHVVNGTIEAQGEDDDDTWNLVVRDNIAERVDAAQSGEFEWAVKVFDRVWQRDEIIPKASEESARRAAREDGTLMRRRVEPWTEAGED